MNFARRLFSCIPALVCLAVLSACTDHPDNPDEIRRRTAEATETMRRDTKAVVEGVREGMNTHDKTVNINKASRADLLGLSGISDREADRIVAERPFDTTHDLVRRHIISDAEYDKIRDQIVAAQ